MENLIHNGQQLLMYAKFMECFRYFFPIFMDSISKFILLEGNFGIHYVVLIQIYSAVNFFFK